MNRIFIAGLAVLVVVLIGADASLFTVSQTEQALVLQFGKVEDVIQAPGLHVKVPFTQNVITLDKRLLAVELPGEEVILGDQRRLLVGDIGGDGNRRAKDRAGGDPDGSPASSATTSCSTCFRPTASTSCPPSAAR